MGRLLTETGGVLAAAAGSSDGSVGMIAGESIAQFDLLQMCALLGKAYPVRVSDNAAVSTVNYGTAQTSTATGQIIAQTAIVAHYDNAYSRQAVVQGGDGSIYTLTADNAGSGGLKLTRFSAAGILRTSVTLAAVDTFSNNHLLLLSNGNLAAVAYTSGGPYVAYAVYDANLTPVKTLTNSELVISGGFVFSAIALSAGGFAIVYQQSANPQLSRLLTLDNAGAIVQAATTIWTRSGTIGLQYHKMVQLSDGNLAIAVSSTNSVSCIGLYHGVVTTAGASVLAFASLDTYSAEFSPEISALAGYYCVARASSTNQRAFVFSNAGALQGAGFSVASTTNTNRSKLLNDGSAFWLIYPDNTSGAKERLAKLPVTGTNYVTTDITTTVSQYNFYLDAFYENGFILATTFPIGGNIAPTMWVISTATGRLVDKAGTPFGSAASGTTADYVRVISGGDFSFISMYRLDAVYSTNLFVGKWANTAIIGVAAADAAVGDLATANPNAGAYAVNAIAGSISKPFDMTATPNLYGNKGVMLPYGAVLKGL